MPIQNFQDFLNILIRIVENMQANSQFAFAVVGIIWGIQLLNFLLAYRVNRLLGLYPRKIRGLPGIFFSPFLHGSFSHVFFNSIPLFVLLDFMCMNGLNSCIKRSLFMIIFSGSALWLLGRRGIHVGASGLIMGFFGYLLIDAYQHFSIKSVLLGIICLYYFGGLALSLFPQEERISWEGHVFGFVAGLGAVFLS